MKPNNDFNAVGIGWIVANPENNKLLTNKTNYKGVGGHLFAIAIQKSIEYGYDGFVYGKAANSKLLKHYIEKFNAFIIKDLNFAIDEGNASKIAEVYDYEYDERNDKKI